jgi:hypothetical protein
MGALKFQQKSTETVLPEYYTTLPRVAATWEQLNNSLSVSVSLVFFPGWLMGDDARIKLKGPYPNLDDAR